MTQATLLCRFTLQTDFVNRVASLVICSLHRSLKYLKTPILQCFLFSYYFFQLNILYVEVVITVKIEMVDSRPKQGSKIRTRETN